MFDVILGVMTLIFWKRNDFEGLSYQERQQEPLGASPTILVLAGAS